MKDVMIDLETLGRKAGCVILSIGAVQFDPRGNGYGEKFYRNISIPSCRGHGLIEEPETVAWWMNQSPQARAGLEINQMNLPNAIYEFLYWWNVIDADRVWCQGASFDAPILEEAMSRVSVSPPWKFWNVRDTRTVYDICGFDPHVIKREGTYHDAIDDSVHQIHCVQAAISCRNKVIEQ